MAKKRKRVDYDSPLMSIYSPEYQYLMRQNAPENANIAGLGDWLSNLFNRNKQQPDYHRDTVSMGLGTENSLQGVGNGGTDWNNQNFSLTNQQQFNYNPNQELTTSQQYQNTLKDPENLAPKQTGEQSAQPSAGSNVNWGGIIGAAGTSAANAIQEGGSAADIAAGIMGIPVLAKMWKANTEWGDARIKEAQEKIANPSVKYIQDANDIQGAGQGIKLNNQKDLNLIDTSGMLNTNNWKKFSSGRGSGTWWKNMATAQLQGAAAGSVGGPWGALGGATAGLLGSIGGLFGSKKRAKRAMEQYNDNMTTLRNYATMENQRRITERNLSNQNMLSNAMTSQKLQDMANIRAYGGNLYPDGGDTNFKSELDWSPESWFSKRVAKPDGTYYNEEEAKRLASHVPEYNQIEQNAKANGTWLKMPDGSTWQGDPRSWVMMQSKAYKDNYANIPLYTGQGAFPTQFDYGNGLVDTDMVTALPYSNDQMWFSDNKNYGDAFAYYYASKGDKTRKNTPDEQDLSGHNFLAAIPKRGKYNSLAAPNGTADDWRYMPYDLVDGRIKRLKDSDIESHDNIYTDTRTNRRKDGKTVLTDDVVNWSKDLGDDAIFLHNIDDGPAIYAPEDKIENIMYRYNHNLPVYRNELKIQTPILKEVITHPDFTKKVKFIEGNTGDFDINNPYKYSMIDDNNYNNIAAMGGHLYTDLSPNMMSLWNNKQNIDKQKIMNQQMNFGLGNSFNTKLNTFDYGGAMNGMDLPTNMQYYENGGSHEENPNGGIQVGQDQQGNPNLVEEGEFRYGDYIFSDRIPVDYSILSDFNVEKGKSNRNTKNNPTYAELAKKTADKYKGLNDKISKDSLNKQLDRLQQSQEAQKFKEQQDQQYADYTNALKSPTQGNPMYGNMKYNGMGNANQGLNAGVDEGMDNPMDNSDLSNVNRSGNPMMAAYGGNLFALGSAVNNPKKILPVETLPGGNQILHGEPISHLELPLSLPTELNNPLIPNRGLTLVDTTPEQKQIILNNLGYDTGGIGNGWGEKSKTAWDNFIYDQTHPNTKYGSTQAGTQTVNNPNSNSTYSFDKKSVKYEGPINRNSPESQTGEVTNSTKTNSSANDIVPVENLGEVDRQQGNLAGSSPFDWNRYNEAGKYGQLAKGLVPNLMNWQNQTNWEFDPNWKPSNELEALGHSSYASRTGNYIGDYIAPHLMDVERLNNSSIAQTAARFRALQDIANGNRGFVAAQTGAADYDGQMVIGNNYATTSQYNADRKLKSAEFNKDTNKFNATVGNEVNRDNLNTWMQGRQMDIQAMEAANRERQFERQYKDRVDRDAALNKQRDLAAMFDNTMNFLADEAEYNRRLNDMNSRRNSRLWYDKKEGWQERNDNSFTSKLRDAIDGAILSSDDFNQISKIQNNDKYTDDEKIAMIQNIADSARARNKQENDAVAAEKKKEIQNYLSEAQSYFNLLNSLQDYQPWNNAKSRYSDPNYFTYTDDLSKEIAKHRMDELQNMWFNYTTRYNPNAVEEVPTPQTTKTVNTSAYGGKLKRKREHDYMSI